jgi:hypothetical protein
MWGSTRTGEWCGAVVHIQATGYDRARRWKSRHPDKSFVVCEWDYTSTVSNPGQPAALLWGVGTCGRGG